MFYMDYNIIFNCTGLKKKNPSHLLWNGKCLFHGEDLIFIDSKDNISIGAMSVKISFHQTPYMILIWCGIMYTFKFMKN